MKEAQVILPKKLSALIQIALADLEKVEARSDVYSVNMDHFHVPPEETQSGKCAVCFAGAVMAMSLDTDIHEDTAPNNYPGNVYQLFALDMVRLYKFKEALRHLGIPVSDEVMAEVRSFDGESYESDPDQFKAAMKKFAGRLEEMGL